MIRFDSTPYDVLAVCQCGWRHHTTTAEAAEAAARAHLETCLPQIPELTARRRALDMLSARGRRRDTP